MNSDQFTSEGTPSQTEETAPTRRRRTGRATSNAAPDAETNPAAPAQVTPETTPAATTTRGRRRATDNTTENPAPRTTRSRRAGAPAVPSTVEETAPPQVETTPAPVEIVMPLSAHDALVSTGATSETAAEAPLARSRRRRGRGGRGGATENTEATAPADVAPVSDESQAWASLAQTPDFEGSADEVETTEAETEAGAATGRRRRRRGRGGRANAQDASAAADEEAEDVMAAPALTTPSAAPARATASPAAVELTPAVSRRFDHGNWRERAGRADETPRRGETLTQSSAPAPQVAAQATMPRPAEAPAAQAVASRPADAATTQAAPVPFERPSHGRRYPERQSAPPVSEIAPQPTMAPATTPVAPPAARSIVAPSRGATMPAIDATPGGGTSEERLERLLTNQSALLQQQQQALQSITTAMASLQGAIERMSTHGIAAGMPRAGMFVDAPNVVYAAENARVNIDYGRMLDFLGRGREMVHAIVYAPVTEETGYRMENQRFVAPFLNKGYKLVTKPLKRFPDGTAKGNFDIELAIDIVTMSQRLDVVVLISGDSDFSRLIELIQSRGVRVEVVAFASNVSWELVQMADVFIDIGQYVDEFRAR